MNRLELLKHLLCMSALATSTDNKDIDSIGAYKFEVACIKAVESYYSDYLKTMLYYFDGYGLQPQLLLDPLHSYPFQPCF